MKQVTLDSQIVKGKITLGRGNVISSKDIANKPGSYPIYSSSAQGKGEFGRYADFMFDEELITWSVDGGGRFFFRNKHKFSVTNVCGYMRIDESKWNTQFVYYSLDLQHAKMAFDYQMKAHPSVIRYIYTLSEILQPEQAKIAEILSTIDQAIEQTKDLVAKQQRFKTGLMQDLLTRGIDAHGNVRSEQIHEFKDSPLGRIPVEWEAVQLDDVIKTIDAGWSPSCEDVTPAQGEWGVLKVSAISAGIFDPAESKRLPLQLKPVLSLEVRPNDVLISRANGVTELVGRCVYVHKTPNKLMLSDKTLRLNPKVEKITPFMLSLQLITENARRQILNFISGSSGQKNLSQKQIGSILIALPPIYEQQVTCSIILHASEQLESDVANLSKLQTLKTALMQDLLTGRKRVTSLLTRALLN